ncbi:MAG: MBL fold metallo-hydrolase [Ruminococcaceae bacterium]|nr:MBL fold metallo-hydrolase [Oscillospiraceae bacterium]
MKITTISAGPLAANCYIVEVGDEAIIIDPGFPEKVIADYIAENPQKIRYIMLTHGHFDHLSAVSFVKERTGAPVLISALDEKGLYDDDFNLSNNFAGIYPAVDSNLRADILFDDGDRFKVGGSEVEVIATPGHSRGSVCFKIDDCLFSGDTLFKRSIGRTDFPGSDMGYMIMSLDKLKCLAGCLTVYPGHGEKTNLEEEKLKNPYLQY